jgi:hypothetical protein
MSYHCRFGITQHQHCVSGSGRGILVLDKAEEEVERLHVLLVPRLLVQEVQQLRHGVLAYLLWVAARESL